MKKLGDAAIIASPFIDSDVLVPKAVTFGLSPCGGGLAPGFRGLASGLNPLSS